MGLSPCHARMQARSPSKPTGGPGSGGQAGGGRSPVPPPTSWPPSTHMNPRLQGMLSWPNTQISRRQVCKAEEPAGTHVLTHTHAHGYTHLASHTHVHICTPLTHAHSHTHTTCSTLTHTCTQLAGSHLSSETATQDRICADFLLPQSPPMPPSFPCIG